MRDWLRHLLLVGALGAFLAALPGANAALVERNRLTSRPRSTQLEQPAPGIRSPVQCPSQLETLMPLMLRDLPSYANRVSQRAYSLRDRTTAEAPDVIPGYVLLAGRPEYQPLSVAAGESGSMTEPESEVPQVFFTTLERQYFAGQATELQHYHWLFLTPTHSTDASTGASTGASWQLVLMLSSLGNERADEPPSPPRDSSQGVIAQAIRLWLRDCAAGSIAAP